MLHNSSIYFLIIGVFAFSVTGMSLEEAREKIALRGSLSLVLVEHTANNSLEEEQLIPIFQGEITKLKGTINRYLADSDSIKAKQIRSTIVALASQHLKTPYIRAGSQPGGFDCSGFTSYVLAQYGIQLSRSSTRQAQQGKRKALKDVQKGDLVFFSRYGKGGRVTHVALVVDNTAKGVEVIHATYRGVVIDNIHTSKYWKPKILYARDVISS